MKLKNKKTGEIVVADITRVVSGVRFDCGQSLAELNTEWEDVPEEPKDFWYIDDFVIMCGTEGEFTTSELATFTRRDIERLKAIGNYFATKEEAEKAVEKLKAWKRLKDKGFRFQGWEDLEAIELPIKNFNNIIGFKLEDNHDVIADLNTLFSEEGC